ncbi:AI-2E family transporter [Rhodococcus sp. D2-41]|uniref:AI-2E family transporter n=1 Tax=Speluncibacter jeojiensis TaxID=2710754 RepID=A0A9X4RD82_9ACTN|nr:AI-2E family transporter [Rhodococcus sp. D2-41]MDG3010893.1 AI-2E family transporter [Rhodococcus sp. D2-41]MDG3013867.1 AI-2E family transporter [Corynebacteriales bacterium D3-21]
MDDAELLGDSGPGDSEPGDSGAGGAEQDGTEPDGTEPIAAAEAQAARSSTSEHPLGRPGSRFDRHSPFMIGLTGAAGVAVTVGVVELVLGARSALVLIALALVLATGLEPVVGWLVRRGLPRWAAVAVVIVVVLLLVAGFLAAVITPLVEQGGQFVAHAPEHLRGLQQRYPAIHRLDQHFHLQQRLTQQLSSDGSKIIGGAFGAGKVVFGAVTGLVIVLVLSGYFLADFPRIRAGIYRLAPDSRRPRAVLLGDEIFRKVGGYVLGNLVISVITALCTFVWLQIFGVPYPLLLAVLVAVLDLIPVVGSTIAGVIVALVALTVSLPVAIGTVAFFVALRLIEDYALVPKIIGRTVEVPAMVTVVAVLLGGAALGIIGALLSIPVAAAVLLLARETVFPQLDRT